MTWPRGTIVACVDDNFDPRTLALATLVPVRGGYYTVRDDAIADDVQLPGVTLMESHEVFGYQRHHFKRMETEQDELALVEQIAETVGA